MNAKHFRIRTKPEDGTIWLTHEKYRQPIVPIKDVTNDILLCLCADLSAGEEARQVERSVKFSDGFSCKITVEVLHDPTEQPADQDPVK